VIDLLGDVDLVLCEGVVRVSKAAYVYVLDAKLDSVLLGCVRQSQGHGSAIVKGH